MVDNSIAYSVQEQHLKNSQKTTSFHATVDHILRRVVVYEGEIQAWCGIAAISCRGNHQPIC
jgi:hypothetical protein